MAETYIFSSGRMIAASGYFQSVQDTWNVAGPGVNYNPEI